MRQEQTDVRRRLLLGLVVAGLILVVLGAVLSLVGGVPAVAGVAAGAVAAGLLVLLGLARIEAPAALSSVRLLGAQPVVLAAGATGVAVAVASPSGDGARVAGGALAAIAVALDCLLIAAWSQRRRREGTG